jgi:hypothetical protein
MSDWIGWVATATFACSYFIKSPAAMRRIQAAAAVLWMSYGVMIHAMPVIIANLIVAVFALFSSLRPFVSLSDLRRTMSPPTNLISSAPARPLDDRS